MAANWQVAREHASRSLQCITADSHMHLLQLCTESLPHLLLLILCHLAQHLLVQRGVGGVDEAVQLGDAAGDLVLQVVREQVHPLGGPGAEGLLEGLGVDLDPAHGGVALQCRHVSRDLLVFGDLGLKASQWWVVLGAVCGLHALAGEELLQGGLQVVLPQVVVPAPAEPSMMVRAMALYHSQYRCCSKLFGASRCRPQGTHAAP
jgi:hypothetical protein